MRRKSTARGSAENVRTLLARMGYHLGQRNLHINFPGGSPVDGPSAGAAMALAAISAITGRPVDGGAAVTGEITVLGQVRPVGGVPSKAEAARLAGIARVYVPRENEPETAHITGIDVIAVDGVAELVEALLLPVGEQASAAQVVVSDEAIPAAAQGDAFGQVATASASPQS